MHKNQGRYAEAEQLYKRALAIEEKALGANRPEVASTLNNFANLYSRQGRYAEAEGLLKRTLTIYEKALGANHPKVAAALGNLGNVYDDQGKYAEAEGLFKRALAIEEGARAKPSRVGRHAQQPGHRVQEPREIRRGRGALQARARYPGESAWPDHPYVATTLSNLGNVYEDEGKYADAEALHKRALAIREKVLGAEHPDVAGSLTNLAIVHGSQGQYAGLGGALQTRTGDLRKGLRPGPRPRGS